ERVQQSPDVPDHEARGHGGQRGLRRGGLPPGDARSLPRSALASAALAPGRGPTPPGFAGNLSRPASPGISAARLRRQSQPPARRPPISAANLGRQPPISADNLGRQPTPPTSKLSNTNPHPANAKAAGGRVENRSELSRRTLRSGQTVVGPRSISRVDRGCDYPGSYLKASGAARLCGSTCRALALHSELFEVELTRGIRSKYEPLWCQRHCPGNSTGKSLRLVPVDVRDGLAGGRLPGRVPLDQRYDHPRSYLRQESGRVASCPHPSTSAGD